MKKFLYMAVAAIAVLSSCDKNDALLDDNGNGVSNADAPVFTATIEGEGETKTQLVEGTTAGKLSKVAWLSTDQIYVCGINTSSGQTSVLGVYTAAPSNDNAAQATLTASSLKINNSGVTASEYYAVYPASISALYGYLDELLQSATAAVLRDQNGGIPTINLPVTQTYNGTNISQIAPMYAYSTTMGNTKLSFKNLTALLAITVSADDFSEVNNIVVKSDKAMNGAFVVSLTENESQYSISSKTATDAQKTLTLNCQNEGANTTIPAEGKTFYVSIPPATYGYLQFEVNGKKGSADVTKTMKTKAASISVARNKIYPIAFADNTADPNLLKGVFTVSAGADGVAGTADDKKVKFTKGNLWWDGSAYQFEANQTAYQTAWNTSHVGHFFWSNYTDYTKTGDKAYTYKPYHSSFGASSKATSDEFWCSKDHPLEVAGTQSLYVLSSEEWDYLLNIPYNNNEVGRKQTNRFAKARVNGKAGLLIFPDDYNGTTELTGITGIATVNEDWDNASYPGESESIDPATWSDMEAAGVVFLPAAGYRGDPNGQTITPGNCYYWSSTPVSNDVARANGLSGNGNQFTCPGTIQRHHGSSIRLVQTVPVE